MTRRLRTRLLVAAAVAAAVGGLVAVAFVVDLFPVARARATDVLFRSRPAETARATTIVAIDQRSYRELLPEHGPLVQWSRRLHARAIEALHAAGPRVIALDIFFDAPRPEDGELVAAMRQARSVLTPVEAQGPRAFRPAPGVTQEFEAFVRPTRLVRDAAAGEGVVNVTTDRDAVVRAVPMVLRAGEEDAPALALAAVARYLRRPRVLDEPAEPDWVLAAGRAIPLRRGGPMRINFLGPPGTPGAHGSVPMIPFVDVLRGTFPAELVRDRIVLVGLTIRGVDEHTTPTTGAERMWGVEILASAIETILAERFLIEVEPATTVGLVLAAALAGALLAALARPLIAAGVTVGLLAAYGATAVALFDRGAVLDLVFAPAAAVGGLGVALLYRVVFEQREQRLVRGVVQRYLSPSVSTWVLEDPGRLHLGGEMRDMTVLFSDLRGFTTMSARLDPHTLVGLLNEYMAAMTEIVFAHAGVLDKYIGDAVMAFWNAPVDQPDHARRACAAALAMVERLHALNAEWERRGLPRLELGVGINTGPMVVGNMGSRDRLAYTVLGDTVNVASRLEGLSKLYGVRVIVGDATRAAAGEAFAYRRLDLVAVKGRAEPLTVWEVVAPAGGLGADAAALLEDYHRGLALYHERRWAEAAAAFADLAARAPVDGPTALYRRRSVTLLEQPPPADWDGVYVAETK